MIKRDAIVKRFMDECKTSQSNQQAVNKVQAWLSSEFIKLAGPDAEALRHEADEAGKAILMLIKCTEAVAGQKSSSVLSGEVVGTPGISQGPPPGGI